MSDHECGCPILRAVLWSGAIPVGIVLLAKQPFDWFTTLMFASIVGAAIGEWVSVFRERREARGARS